MRTASYQPNLSRILSRGGAADRRWRVRLLCLGLMAVLAAPTFGASTAASDQLTQQREDYLAARKARATSERDNPTQFVCAHPERFRIRLLPAPAEIDREDFRLTVDIEEDWENALAIFEALGPEELDWQRIAHLLDHQPAMRKRMAALNRAYAPG